MEHIFLWGNIEIMFQLLLNSKMKKIVLILLVFSLSLSVYAVSPETQSTFKVQAKIEKGCSLKNIEQNIDFGQHAALSQNKINASIINSGMTWSIKCTEKMPVSIMLNEGENFENSNRRMKHSSISEYIDYKLYTSSTLNSEYLAGNSYSLTPTTAANPILDFSIYGVANLGNNNQSRSAGIYKDTVLILITW